PIVVGIEERSGAVAQFKCRVIQSSGERKRRTDCSNDQLLCLRTRNYETADKDVIAGLHSQPGGDIRERRCACLRDSERLPGDSESAGPLRSPEISRDPVGDGTVAAAARARNDAEE